MLVTSLPILIGVALVVKKFSIVSCCSALFFFFVIWNIDTQIQADVSPAKVSKHFENAEEATVAIYNEDGSRGSGVVRYREKDGQTFILTDAHVVEPSVVYDKRVDIDGKEYQATKVTTKPLRILKRFRNFDNTIAVVEGQADIIKVSQVNDFAILKMNKSGIFNKDTKFYLKDTMYPVGSPVFHVGMFHSLRPEEDGISSLTIGNLSQLNFSYQKLSYDLFSLNAVAGCSGGGVYLSETGECIGFVCIGYGNGMILASPIKRLKKWAESEGVMWAFDNFYNVPTDYSKVPMFDKEVVK